MAGRLNYEKLNKQKQISRYGYESALSDILPASNGGRKASIAKATKKGKNRDAGQYAYNFLTTVLDKLAKGDAEPLIPKKAPENVRREIEKSGGAFLWAESQPDYWDLLQKKKKKLNRKVTHRTTVVTSSSNDDNIRILRGKLDEHEKGMRRAETEYEKHAHALKDLKQRSAELEAKISDC